MRAEEFRKLKTQSVYSPAEINSPLGYKQPYATGAYCLVTIGRIISAIKNMDTAGNMLSMWNSMYRNTQWATRASKESVKIDELPISREARKMLGRIYSGRISKKSINNNLRDEVLDIKIVNDYVVALYYEAQMFKEPMVKFKQAMATTIGESLADKLFSADPAWAKLTLPDTFTNLWHITVKDKGVVTTDVTRIPVLVRCYDEAIDVTKYVPVVVCKKEDIEKYAKSCEAIQNTLNVYCGETSTGCFKHIYKFNKATEIRWFE